MNLDLTQKESVILDEKGILAKQGRGFHFCSAFAKKNLYYLLWSDEYICTPEYVVERESLSCYILMNILSGRMSVTTEGKTFTVKAGQVLLLDLNKPHYYTALTNLKVQQYMLDGNALSAYYTLLQEKYGTGLVFQKDSKLSSVFLDIQKETMEPVPNDHRISALISEMLSLFAAGSGSGENDPVRQAKYYMSAHYKEDISLEDIAASVSLSKYYFSRVFEKESGCTPWEFLTEIRMRNAMQMLTHSNGSVENIAMNCGFSNAAHFIRSFKNFTGFTPGLFRKYFTDVSMGMEMRRFWDL